MNHYLNTLLRSIIESLTEFLPVSSTGHLYLFSNFFPFEGLANREDFEDLFDIFIQGGAILSVFVVFFPLIRDRVLGAVQFIRKESSDRIGYDFCLGIILGSVPIMAFGFAFKKILDKIKTGEHLLLLLSITWIIGGVLFLILEKWFQKRQIDETAENVVSVKHSVIIGFFQCIALIPGVSRSAATIITGRVLGYSRKTAAEYSFFLALPALTAASFYKLYKHKDILNSENIIFLVLGFVLTFIFCMAVIKWFLGYIRKHGFEIFGIYRIVLGSTVLALYFLK